MQLTARAAAVITAVVTVAAASAVSSGSSSASGLVSSSVGSLVGSLVGTAAAPVSAVRCTSDLPQLRYLVLFEAGTARSDAEAEVIASCGGTVVYYPEIAVAVASSTDRSFADRIGRDRAYSAQAEALTGRQRPARPHGRGLVNEQTEPAEPGGTSDRSGEQWNMALIRAAAAHAVTSGSADVLVGVLDSGIDADHPDLAAAIDRSASAGCTTGKPDTNATSWRPAGQHGTHVAGLIAAASDGRGVTGVAPGVRIAAVRVVDAAGFIYPEYAVCGLLWAAKRGMRVANNSYFVDPWLFTCRDQPGQAVVSEAVRRATAYATSSGVLLVAAVGNEGVDLANPSVDSQSPNNGRRVRRPVDDRCEVLPAELPGVLTVSAVGAQRIKSSYSSYGAGVVDVAAPGGDIRQRAPGLASGCVLSTIPGGGYGRMCGTSMATPHVAGIAALLASRHPDAGPAELAALVHDSAQGIGCPDSYDPNSDGRQDARCRQGDAGEGNGAGDGNGFYGSGLVDALAAVRR